MPKDTPPRRSSGGLGPSRAITLAAGASIGVIALVLLIVLVVRFSAKNGGSHLGDPVAEYNAADLAHRITRDYGAPILLPDLLGKGRAIYIGHDGTNPKVGWVGFKAVPPGAPQRCILAWDRVQKFLGDPVCHGPKTYDRLGTGLDPVVVYVGGANKNHLVIDLRPGAVAPATTTSTTTP